MLHLSENELGTVQAILRAHLPHHEVRAFGSRVHGKHLKPFSDPDLAIITKTPLDNRTHSALQNAFTDSDLPFRVDLVERHSVSELFRSNIEEAYETIQLPEST